MRRSSSKRSGQAATEKDAAEKTPRNPRKANNPEDILGDLEIHQEELRNRAVELEEATSALGRWAHFFADAPVGYVTLDEGGTIQDANLAAGQMLELDPTQAKGSSFLSFLGPGQEWKLSHHLRRCRTQSESVRTQLTLSSPSGRSIETELVSRQAVYPEGGVRFWTVLLDLTELRRIEEAFHASQRRLSAAVEASGAGVFEHAIPFDGKLHVNRRLSEILGISRAEISSRSGLEQWIARHLHSEDRELLGRLYHELDQGHRSHYQGDVRFRQDDGSVRWLRIWAKAAPLSQRSSRVRRLVGAAMEVTEEKERTLEIELRARQLRALASELYRVEERERRQLATELHDNLAQLIAATKMKLGLIGASEAKEKLEQTVDESLALLDRADESVRSVTFSLSPPVLDELGLSPAIRWLAKDVEKQFGLSVEVVEEGKVPPVDPRLRFMLFRSIRELLVNAAKHASVDRARVLLQQREQSIWIRVEDEGKGFDPDQVRRGDGHGFGLFSIQERLESMGGKFDVRSAPGRGTKVTIVVHRALEEQRQREVGRAAAPPGEAASCPASPGPRERIRVLLADDHDLVRSALARLLNSQPDLEVVAEASDGESALELTGLLTPDVVLMDVTMAGVGGIEATRRISKEHPEARVVGLSMHESADIVSAMRTAGAVDYVQKNCPTHVLLGAIRKAAIERLRAEPSP